MADEIVIRLPGKPVGKGRPRFTVSGHAYTPPATRALEKALAAEAMLAMRGRTIMEGPVAVDLHATFQIPKSWSKAAVAAAMAVERYPTVRPDLDNLAKVIDAFNGIVWKDDAQVVSATITKIYGAEPGMEFRVRAIVEREAA